MLEKRDGFFGLSCPTWNHLSHGSFGLIYKFYLSIKWFLLSNMSFYLIFLYIFYVFVNLLRCMIVLSMIDLFVNFHVDDSVDNAV